MDAYAQSLLDKIVSMGREIGNLREAYMIVNQRLNHLTNATEETVKELLEEAARVEDFAKLAVEATKLTEQSAILTNDSNLMNAAKKSTAAAQTVHQLAVDLRANKLPNLKPNW
ncbi:hypothetical protein M2128_002268 [Polynucleobacter sphagniphilus]|jgi:hypothetical protein|uniref:hypothetical protein n=1 Tax=Polynucleobacter sphagniphilus TaxID=1743169 RepID=UPI0024771E08|nr:hypothetical protein [Polynucleobacter sphagniphilus]MDH6303321.1 hypothetical protein [Polynucleobacter sphagniphilus]